MYFIIEHNELASSNKFLSEVYEMLFINLHDRRENRITFFQFYRFN